MKYLCLNICFFLCLGTVQAQANLHSDGSGTPKIALGLIPETLLTTDSDFAWFPEAQKIYIPKPAMVKRFSQYKNQANFTVVMGTWCSDSHFVVPRFFTLIRAAGMDPEKVQLIGVDRHKKDPQHLSDRLHIDRVPTIIVYKNGKEMGRVVEYGTTGRFDEELARLLEKPY